MIVLHSSNLTCSTKPAPNFLQGRSVQENPAAILPHLLQEQLHEPATPAPANMASNTPPPAGPGPGWVYADKSPITEPLFNAEPGTPPSPEPHLPSSSPAPDAVEDDGLPRTPAKNGERAPDDPPCSLLVELSGAAGSKALVQSGKRAQGRSTQRFGWSPDEPQNKSALVDLNQHKPR